MKSYDDILIELCAILAPYANNNLILDEGTELVSDIGLDSLQVMQILLEVEDRFDISIPLNIIPDVRTIKDFVLQLEHLTRQS
ncbi:MAG: acyl carrier protein [Nitrospiraceae bacterium]|nr:acyl carrier protein [Nitrospiraceae bacterium]|tara:strand:- start:6351 stop:6599 length:249 start_codon:yes stop_codon:yes gene_type:complete